MNSPPLDSRHITGYPYWVNTRGHVYSEKRDMILKSFLDKGSRPEIVLYDYDGIRQKFLVHRLVVMMFPELIRRKELHEQQPNIYCEIDHIDLNKQNNRVENLRWCSSAENSWNTRALKTSNLHVKGLSTTPSKTYNARVKKNGKVFRKNFKTQEEAEAYLHEMRLKLHGEFAHD